MTGGATLLAATGLVGGYGGNDILNGIDLAVTAGEIAVIVGPNGAGKSTAMKAIFGIGVGDFESHIGYDIGAEAVYFIEAFGHLFVSLLQFGTA